MFPYFPSNYSWNLGLLMALQLGGDLNEIDRACRPLIEIAAQPDVRANPRAQRAWYEAWSGLARQLAATADGEETAGHRFSAGRKNLRAAVYWMTAERLTTHGAPEKMAAYQAFLDRFARGIRLRDEPIEPVEVPFGAETLDALFVPAAASGPAPLHDPFRRLRCAEGMGVAERLPAGTGATRRRKPDPRPPGCRVRAAPSRD